MKMIDFQKGDILRADVEALVNTVNCVGVMGRGIALRFKGVFPANFRAYKKACEHKEVQPGRMFVFETLSTTNPRYIINFPTKRHWRGKSRMEDIDAGLKALVDEIQRLGIKSIAIPPLGAGLGGLDWSDVRLSNRNGTQIPFRMSRSWSFEPSSERDAKVPSHDVPKMTPGRAALVGLMHRYLRGLLDPFVTLLEVHKTYVLYARGGAVVEAHLCEGDVWTVCGEPSSCASGC